MNHYLNLISTYLNKLSLRERLLVLFVSLAVVYALWDGIIYSAQNDVQQQLLSQQNKLLAQQQQLDITNAQSNAQSAVNQRSKQQQQHAIEQLHNKSAQMKVELNKLIADFVPPTKITELLQNLLLETQGLKLLELNNEPVEVISFADDNQQDEQNTDLPLYLHATTIKLSGDYQQLYQYLRSLEDSQWNLYWQNLQYQVSDYPSAEIIIKVYTISVEQYWIGL